jgi:transcriptional regulator with XRE-family HTH domain
LSSLLLYAMIRKNFAFRFLRMPGKRLGEKIREDRKALGWTLRELASKVNISLATLQRIETGAVSPTVDLLTRIAFKLQQPIVSFLADKKSTFSLIRGKDFKVIKDRNKTLRVAPAREIFPVNVKLFHFEANRGAMVDPQTRKGYEGGLVLKGKMRIKQGGEYLEISPGEAYLLDTHYSYIEEFPEETEVVGLMLRM